MKTLFLFHLVFVVLIFFHWTEARRKEAKWIKQENHQLKSEKNNPTKKSLQRKVKDNKSIKVNGSIERHDVLQRKRQFVPGMPFLNFAHPHIHRIIVHHHPAHSSCEPTPCQNGGTCTVVSHGFECTCSPGFMGTHCELRSECEPNPCRNGGTCYDVGQGYECTCARGFRGENCEEQNKCHPNPCRNGGTCTGINEGEGFECTCREGYKGKNCEEVNLCLPNPCKNGATCTERTGGRYECTCPIGYKGVTCEERSICYSNPCMYGGTCLDEAYGYRCSCRAGYSGINCQNHICKPNPCHNGGSCIEEGSSYRCVCQVGNHGERCELLSSCLSHPCLHGGTCIDTYFLHSNLETLNMYSNPAVVDSQENGLAYICKCVAPYAGHNCEDDRCRFCHANAECIFSHCVCKEGYHGDGKSCKRNVCHPNPCKNGATCVPTDSSYDCDCVLGWTGPHCETRQYCVPNPCKNGGTCIPQEDGYKCNCLSNYEGNDCEKANVCSPNPCKNGGLCKEMNGVATCECPPRYEGNFCEMDKCAKCDSHARCDNGNCVCMEGWVGDGQTCTPEDGGTPGRSTSCDPNPCQNGGQCIEQGGSYQCSCKEGYSGDNCELPTGLSNPCEPNPCQNGGQCTLVDKKPVCSCPEGYEGEYCEKATGVTPGNKSPCHPNPCMNGGSCTENGGGYDCSCTSQFSGPNCEIDECEKCDVHALCPNGHCKCKHGYIGNGYQCEKEEPDCEGCSPFARCQNGICVCVEHFTGDGYNCQPAQPCFNCQAPNVCLQGSCVPPSNNKKSEVKKLKNKRAILKKTKKN